MHQDVLHGIQIHPLQRDVLGSLIGFQHRVELLRLAGGQRHGRLLGTLAFVYNASGVAAGARHDVVGIGLRLVAHALGVGIGALHVAEALDHRVRRIDPLQLHLGDLDAGAVLVQDLLGLVVHVGFDLGAQLGQRRLDRGAADYLADRAFRHRLNQVVRVAGIEQIGLGVADLPEHRQVDVDDVLVAGQHQAFGRDVASGRRALGAVALLAARAVADLGAVDAGDRWQQDMFDRPGQVPVEAGLGAVAVGAEAHHHTEFVRLHPVEAGAKPEQYHHEAEQKDGPATSEAHARAATAAEEAAHERLQAGDEHIDIGHRAGPSAAGAARARATGTAAAPRSAATAATGRRPAGAVTGTARRKSPGALAAMDHGGSAAIH